MREIRSVRGIEKESQAVIHCDKTSLFVEERDLTDKFSTPNQEPQKNDLPLVGKKTIPQDASAKADKKWAKVEAKTENILKVNTEKTRRRRVEDIKCTQGIQKISSVSFTENPSRLDYTALRGDNKVMLNLIIEHITDEFPYWMVGTDELSRKSLMNESTLKTVIQRLKKKGFINVKRGVGERLITVNPSILSF